MARKKRDWLPVSLMSAGLLLLLASQIFWLQRTYRTEKAQFIKRSGELLEISVRELYDALTIKRLHEEVGVGAADSTRVRIKLGHEPGHHQLNYSTTVIKKRGGRREPRRTDPSAPKAAAALEFDTGHMIVFTELNRFETDTMPGEDSILARMRASGLDKLIAGAERAPMGIQVLLGLGGDSLSADTVRTAYTLQLRQEGIDLPFSWRTGDAPLPDDALATHTVAGNMFGSQQFQAYFPHYRAFLLSRMWEEVLFSALLFALIAAAFAVIYRSLRKQHRLSMLKNDLLSNIAHELKTPISSVSVAIEALRDFGVLKDPGLTREYLDISRDELQRLSLLVDRVLRLTTFEQKEPELQLEMLDMAEVSRTILRTMQVQFDQYEAGHELELAGSDFRLRGDRIHLSSVLFNLLDNALKYRNGGRPEVRLRLEATTERLQISVEDNGIGIPPEYRHRIFEKFFRVPQGNVHNIKGYGLGLSYVAAVVHRHGGTISLDSHTGRGSCFTLSFPKMKENGTDQDPIRGG